MRQVNKPPGRRGVDEPGRLLGPHRASAQALQATVVEVMDDEADAGEGEGQSLRDLVDAASLGGEAQDGNSLASEGVGGAHGLSEGGVLVGGEGADEEERLHGGVCW